MKIGGRHVEIIGGDSGRVDMMNIYLICVWDCQYIKY